MIRIVMLTAMLCLTGCERALHVLAKPEPFDVHSLPICDAPCEQCLDLRFTINSNPDSARDAAENEHTLRKACAALVDKCDQRRQACASALQRGRDAGAIR